MGTAHKLKPEIQDFILERKRADSALSCRKISFLIKERFQVELSKSLINALMKQSGLSAPVGRRRNVALAEQGKAEILVEKPLEQPSQEAIPPAQIEEASLQPPVEEKTTEPVALLEQKNHTEVPLLEAVEQKESVELPLEPSAETPSETAEEPSSAETPVEKPTITPPEEVTREEAAAANPPDEGPSQEGFAVEEAFPPVSPRWEKEPAKSEGSGEEAVVEEPPKEEIPVEKPAEVAPEKPAIEEPPQEEKEPAEEEIPVEEPVVGEASTPPELLIYQPTPDAAPAEEVLAQAAAGEPGEQPAPPEPAKEPHKESLVETHYETSPEVPDLSEGVGGGTVLLKAVDSIIGGSYYITRLVKERQHRDEPDLISRTEGLLYSPLFKPPVGADSTFWTLINSNADFQLIISYLEQLQQDYTLDIDANRMVPKLFQEVLFLDIFLESGEVYHLDSELRSIWSVPNIPYDYALPVNKAKNLINRYFIRNKPIVLFTAPGFDVPTKEFCDFITAWDNKEKTIAKITLVSNKLDTIETIIPPPAGQRFVVFGLWPWQFSRYRRVINIGEFKQFYFEPLGQHFYITESEVTLLQPYTKQSLVFRACLLKRDPLSKTTLIIGTNVDEDKASTEEIAKLYLSHWPNLEEGYEDFSRKIELFTYTATSRKTFSIESALLETGKEMEIKELFNYYLRGLDAYLRWHLLPAGYEDFDFPTANQRFYSLKAVFYKKKGYYLVQFYIAKNYAFEADLAYMCRRFNEKDVMLRGGKIWFTYIKEPH